MRARNMPLTCRHCGEILGTYELLVVREDGTVRETSRAAEPELSTASGEYYHEACNTAQFGASRTTESD
jgi:hypothetical protein